MSFYLWFLLLFLETQIFVEKLFDAVNTKSYLPPPEQPSAGSLKVEFFQHQEKDIKKEEVKVFYTLFRFFKHIQGIINFSLALLRRLPPGPSLVR